MSFNTRQVSFLVESKGRTYCGIFVYDDKTPRVHLKCRECPLSDGETRQITEGYEATAAHTKWLIPPSKAKVMSKLAGPQGPIEPTNSLAQRLLLKSPTKKKTLTDVPQLLHPSTFHRRPQT